MAKSQQTFNKKEKEKKRLKKREDKFKRKEERKANSTDGSLENMMAYVDENGNISDTPPDPAKMKKFKASESEISVPKQVKEDLSGEHTGKVTFFNDAKGYGFIKDHLTQESIFVHVNELSEPIQENDKVIFEVERGLKGMNAVRVKKKA